MHKLSRNHRPALTLDASTFDEVEAHQAGLPVDRGDPDAVELSVLIAEIDVLVRSSHADEVFVNRALRSLAGVDR